MLGKNLITAATGAAGAGGGVLGVEDVFSTWLYTGTGSTQTITNGIDLAGEGGLVWTKWRSGGAYSTESHCLIDTARSAPSSTPFLRSDTTGAAANGHYFNFSSTGYDIVTASSLVNHSSGGSYASWTFRKAEKFFDVVTYTGDGVAGRAISHSLGSTPGFIIVKRTDTTAAWYILHRGSGTSYRGQLNSDAALSTSNLQFYWGDGTNYIPPTSSDFTVYSSSDVNASGGTYVAYLFAHDAGGFGDSGDESVIKCGSYTGSAAAVPVDLGWEPQWLLVKKATGSSSVFTNWAIFDNMRGVTTSGYDVMLAPNLSTEEGGTNVYPSTDLVDFNSTGFTIDPTASQYSVVNTSGETYIYIAIRRGPMKTPTDATEVFNAIAYAGNNSSTRYISGAGFPPDLSITKARNNTWLNHVYDRLRGNNRRLITSARNGETGSNGILEQDGITIASVDDNNTSGYDYVNHFFRRAPGFFDVVAYTGTGVVRTVPHNLGVAPELMIVKSRSISDDWIVYHSSVAIQNILKLQSTAAATDFGSPGAWNNTAPTASVFTVSGTGWSVNNSGQTYIAYLFATCPGVSKVGSYTGTGTTLNIDCGFAAGSRFVLIKRTDSTGDWYVYDSARGIVSGNDPYLLINSTAAEVTGTDYIDPLASGFQITSTAPAAINASGGSFIFLAVA